MADAQSSPISPHRLPRVLIIEDEYMIAELISDMLPNFGYAVSGMAHTIATARQELAKRNFDAVLLDIGFDNQHSPEMADFLTEACIPFAFVTGFDHSFEPRHDQVPLLRKPFTEDQVRALLEKLVGRGASSGEMAKTG
jgi:DNA-binding response OmpR family regulator